MPIPALPSSNQPVTTRKLDTRNCPFMLCCAKPDIYILGRSVLIELRLENYAVIDNAAIEFASGLNLLTGETGAGKSILIDALGLLLGDKASTDVIRTGADRAVVMGVFESEGPAQKTIEEILETNGLDADSGDGSSGDGLSGERSLILRREIAAGGKGRVFINNQPATVAVLKALAPHLGAIHAQNESIANFDA